MYLSYTPMQIRTCGWQQLVVSVGSSPISEVFGLFLVRSRKTNSCQGLSLAPNHGNLRWQISKAYRSSVEVRTKWPPSTHRLVATCNITENIEMREKIILIKIIPPIHTMVSTYSRPDPPHSTGVVVVVDGSRRQKAPTLDGLGMSECLCISSLFDQPLGVATCLRRPDPPTLKVRRPTTIMWIDG